jgi:phosphate transport system substrate-binding protein
MRRDGASLPYERRGRGAIACTASVMQDVAGTRQHRIHAWFARDPLTERLHDGNAPLTPPAERQRRNRDIRRRVVQEAPVVTWRNRRVTFATPKRIAGVTFAAAVLVAACGGSGAATQAPAQGQATGSGVEGEIVVSGSSTVEPISTGVAEAFHAMNPEVRIEVTGPGTGDGFKRFCAGETDISDASRTIKDEEAAACKDAGIEYVELKIAYDGITILTSNENTAIACLSFADLYALTGPESTSFAKWSDAAALAKELGSNTVMPDAALAITGPGEESGTYDTYVELALKKLADERGQDAATRPDYTANANDFAIIEGISGSPTSLGWVGFAFAEENIDKVKEIEVAKDANGTCVAPSAETIGDGSYPLSRSLYIYVNKAKAAENPAVAAYVDYYLADGTIATALETIPYVNLPADALAETRAAWEAAK